LILSQKGKDKVNLKEKIDKRVKMKREIRQFMGHLKRRSYSPHTIKNYEVDLKLFFEVIKKGQKDPFRKEQIERFIEYQHKKGLSPNTINRRLYALKFFIDFVIEQGEIRFENPIRKSTFCRYKRPLPRACRDQDIERLFEVISDPYDKGIFTLMLRCGLRVSEVANLKVSDIDFTNQTLFIREGKGGKDRSVYMSDDSVFILKRCLWERKGRDIKTEYFFFNKKNKARGITPNAIQKKIERYSKKASINKISCHQLRHTFAKNLLEEGTGIVTIKKLLGHESLITSEKYTKLSDEKVKKDYFKAMEKILKENPI